MHETVAALFHAFVADECGDLCTVVAWIEKGGSVMTVGSHFDGIKGQESAVVGTFDELFHRAGVVFIDDFGSYHFAAYQAHKIKR